MTPYPFVSIATPEGMKNIRYDEFVKALLKPGTEFEAAAHIGLGIAGEAGEFADAVKKEYIYGKPRDKENVVEELGDLLFYIQAALNHYEVSWFDVLQANAIKLSKRYTDLVWNAKHAIDRADKDESIGWTKLLQRYIQAGATDEELVTKGYKQGDIDFVREYLKGSK